MEHINIVLTSVILAAVVLTIVLTLSINHYYALKKRRHIAINHEASPSPEPVEDTVVAVRKRSTTDDDIEAQQESVNLHYPILTLHIFAKPGQKFAGYELLQSLLAVGLRFGEMNIFHRYETMNANRGPILFSLTCATKPGTFDIPNMGAFACRGLSLFMRLSSNPTLDRQRFELMLDTAQQLSEELDGKLYDQERCPLDGETLNHWRAYVSNNKNDETNDFHELEKEETEEEALAID